MQELQMTRKAAAYKIHLDIMAAGEVAAEAFSTFCKLLKTMRDDKLYQELEYSSFEAYCENAVGLKYRQAFNYIKVLENFGEQNLQSNAGLGIRKLELIASAPEESREDLLDKAEDMTTRQIEAAVKEYKAKLEAEAKEKKHWMEQCNLQAGRGEKLEKELREKQEWADKQAKYAEESNKRAREAEWELDKKEKSIATLRTDLEYAKKRLADAKAKGDDADIKKLTDTISWQVDRLNQLQEENEELVKQLHSKPIEVPAAKIVEEKVVEKEVIPDEIAEAIYHKVAALYEGLLRLTAKEIQVFAENVSPDYYDDVMEQINDAVGVLNKIDNAVFDANSSKSQQVERGHCQDCDFSDRDKVTNAQYNDGNTWCLMKCKIVGREFSCEQFEERG